MKAVMPRLGQQIKISSSSPATLEVFILWGNWEEKDRPAPGAEAGRPGAVPSHIAAPGLPGLKAVPPPCRDSVSCSRGRTPPAWTASTEASAGLAGQWHVPRPKTGWQARAWRAPSAGSQRRTLHGSGSWRQTAWGRGGGWAASGTELMPLHGSHVGKTTLPLEKISRPPTTDHMRHCTWRQYRGTTHGITHGHPAITLCALNLHNIRVNCFSTEQEEKMGRRVTAALPPDLRPSMMGKPEPAPATVTRRKHHVTLRCLATSRLSKQTQALCGPAQGTGTGHRAQPRQWRPTSLPGELGLPQPITLFTPGTGKLTKVKANFSTYS